MQKEIETITIEGEKRRYELVMGCNAKENHTQSAV